MLKLFKKVKISKVYYYPLAILLILVALSAFKISGTSIGSYQKALYPQGSHDSNLLLNSPREIRSDEWRVVTQAIIAQKEAGFPHINKNFNEDLDMSLLTDAPYIEWSVLFKPQHFSFFVMPLENAFAFKWWLLLVFLLLSTYFLCLKLVPNRIVFAICVSVIAGFSPFVFWWYQTTTILSLAYSILIILFGIRLIDRDQIRICKKELSTRTSTIINGVVFAYLLVAFALLLYPPFQIPVALIAGFFLLGYLLNAIRKKTKRQIAMLLIPFACAVALTGVICGTFILTRADVVGTISSTAYPGKRSVPSGGYDINHLLVNFLQLQLIENNSQSNYYFNQSEESSFILLPLFFIVPLAFILVYLYVRKKQLDWIIIGLLIPCLLILAHMFIPFASPVSKLFFLHLVPIERAIIGLGLSAILILIYIAHLYQKTIKISHKMQWVIAGYVFIFCMLAILSGLHIREMYPNLIPSRKLLVLYALILYAGLYLFLRGKTAVGAVILALFSIVSVWQVHPLYVGFGEIYNHKLTHAIKTISNPDDTWAVAEDVRFENLPQMSNRKAITGIAFYPNLDFWDKYSESNNRDIYNRYAHIVLDDKTTQPILLVQKDIFVVSTQCGRKLTTQIDFMLSTRPIEKSCYTLVKTIVYPNQTFYIYKNQYNAK